MNALNTICRAVSRHVKGIFSTALLLFSTTVFAGEKLVFGEVSGLAFTQITKEILSEAYRRIGIDVGYRAYPGKRSLVESNSGRIDGELMRIEGMETSQKNLLMIPVVLNKITSVVVSKDPAIKVNGWDSLREYKIGIRRGVKFTEIATRGWHRTVVNSHEELFELLERGLIDLFIFDKFNCLKLLEQNSFPNVVMLDPPLQVIPMYHYLHKKHHKLLPAITSVLLDLEREGFIEEARKKFLRDIEK